MAIPSTAENLQSLPIPLERDLFLRSLIRELSGTLQDAVGLEEASGFVSVVGQRIGEQINDSYKSALQVSNSSRKTTTRSCWETGRCPFAEKVIGRPTMCMMTSNVFGVIAAENVGYAKVVLEETIAQGAPGCRVVVHLKPTAEAQSSIGREYFKG